MNSKKLEKEVYRFKKNIGQYVDLEVKPYCKLSCKLALYVDLLYPWFCLYTGLIRWAAYPTGPLNWLISTFHWLFYGSRWMDPNTLWNGSLIIAGLIWSVSAGGTLHYLNISGNETDLNYLAISIHLIVSMTGSLLQLIDTVLAGVMGFVVFTLVFRSLHLICLLVYFWELKFIREQVEVLQHFFVLKTMLEEFQNKKTRTSYGSTEEE